MVEFAEPGVWRFDSVLTAIVLIRVVEVNPIVVWCVFIATIITLSFAMVLRFRTGKWRNIKLID